MAYGIADDLLRTGILGHGPVDEIDGRDTDPFAELLKTGQCRDMVETIAICAKGRFPVEFLFRVDRQQRTLSEAIGKARSLR